MLCLRAQPEVRMRPGWHVTIPSPTQGPCSMAEAKKVPVAAPDVLRPGSAWGLPQSNPVRTNSLGETSGLKSCSVDWGHWSFQRVLWGEFRLSCGCSLLAALAVCSGEDGVFQKGTWVCNGGALPAHTPGGFQLRESGSPGSLFSFRTDWFCTGFSCFAA